MNGEDDSGDMLEEDSTAVQWLEDDLQEPADSPEFQHRCRRLPRKLPSKMEQKPKNFQTPILKRFDLLDSGKQC